MTYAARLLSEPDDRAALLALWMETMSSRPTSSLADWRYAWQFQHSPAGPPTLCLTHHVETRSVVACASAHPRRTQVGDATLTAGVLGDFAVSRPHRTAGAALAVQRRLMTEALERFELIYGCPNKIAEPIFKRLGFHTVGKTLSLSRPLRTGEKLVPLVGAPWVAGLAGAFLDRALAASDARVLLRRPFRYRAEIGERADERVDELWRRARHHYGITGERSTAHLNWRYADFPTARHRLFAATERRGGRLLGYVMFVVEDGVATVGDLLVDDPRRQLPTLLLMFAAEMRAAGVRSIWLPLMADRDTVEQLRRILFWQRAESRSLVLRTRDDLAPALVERLRDDQQWFMVGGELDT